MTDEEIFEAVKRGLVRAELLHPGFAEGQYEALGHLSEEHGEVTKAITKGEGKRRMQEELIDLIVVAWRMLRGDHERPDCDCAKGGGQC